MRLKKQHILLPAIGLLMAGSIFFSCTRDKGKITPACDTPAVISFSNDLIPLFHANCSISGCHTGANPTGNLNLDATAAYTNLMRRGSGYIDTINPNFSLLYSQMISASDPMPPTGLLNSCKTELVLKWIEQKAKNN
jgi:hypothetical protein